MTKPSRRKGGLGRGLASLIPTGPADGGPRLGEAAADVVIGGTAGEVVVAGGTITGRLIRPPSSPTRASHVRSSTRRRLPSLCIRSVSSA